MRRNLRSRSVKAGVVLGLLGVGVALGVSYISEMPLHPAAPLLVGALAGVSGWTAVKWSLRPLGYFVEQAQLMAKAQFDGEGSEWRGPDEYRPLADAFDELRIGLRLYAGRIARRAIEFEGTLEVLDLAHSSASCGRAGGPAPWWCKERRDRRRLLA